MGNRRKKVRRLLTGCPLCWNSDLEVWRVPRRMLQILSFRKSRHHIPEILLYKVQKFSNFVISVCTLWTNAGLSLQASSTKGPHDPFTVILAHGLIDLLRQSFCILEVHGFGAFPNSKATMSSTKWPSSDCTIFQWSIVIFPSMVWALQKASISEETLPTAHHCVHVLKSFLTNKTTLGKNIENVSTVSCKPFSGGAPVKGTLVVLLSKTLVTSKLEL